ncbi:UDP-N-acetylmuramoyl-tripeptide--D-alanyl-D-alanine ligase [Candidatus Dependentiae bacterium]|nr:UDP-N-acetylmuramoyl-tripeptide--D-alanyl-D-alanine ligase [Candidatus Dependentiae bacterium]
MTYDLYFFKNALPNAKIKTYKKDSNNFFSEKKIKGFCIDSRKIQKEELFIALSGQRVDGHYYIEDVLLNGAIGLIIQKDKINLLNKINEKVLNGKIVIIVDDTLDALKQLAKNWRKGFKFPIIGITGSVGKTTTKQLLASIFKTAKISAFISFKNQNTVIGLSLNILKMRKEHKFAVFEMGISHKGEMEELANILRPDIGVITYICNAHTKGLGNLKEIINEKQKIFKYFKSDNVGIIWGDKSFLDSYYYDFPIITFGLKTKNHIQARMIKNVDSNFTKFNLKIYFKKYPVTIKSNHLGFINNILAASSIATFLKIETKFIIQGIQNYKDFEGRFERRKIKNNKGILINDSYNASPESMKAALKAFSALKNEGKKIAVLGDMLELGEKEVFWHRQIGRILSKNLDLNKIILVGKLAENIAKTMPAILKGRTTKVKDWKAAKELLDEMLLESNNQILLKASRGIGLDNIIKDLT